MRIFVPNFQLWVQCAKCSRHPRALRFLPKCFYTNSHTFQEVAKIFEKKKSFSIHPTSGAQIVGGTTRLCIFCNPIVCIYMNCVTKNNSKFYRCTKMMEQRKRHKLKRFLTHNSSAIELLRFFCRPMFFSNLLDEKKRRRAHSVLSTLVACLSVFMIVLMCAVFTSEAKYFAVALQRVIVIVGGLV